MRSSDFGYVLLTLFVIVATVTMLTIHEVSSNWLDQCNQGKQFTYEDVVYECKPVAKLRRVTVQDPIPAKE